MSSFLNKLKEKSNLAKLKDQISDAIGEKNYENKNYWKLDVDKSTQIGEATIRFLPAPDGEDLPFTLIYKHAFQVEGRWYIENSLTTLGQKDYVSEDNTRLWNTGIEENKKIASQRKRGKKYISNILVVNDPKHPENNGKVFLFEYGQNIFNMINTAINPEFADEVQFDPFDMIDGADFVLRSSKKNDQRTYEKSKFKSVAPISKDEDHLEKIYNSMHSLKAEIAADKFKDYDTLKSRFLLVTKGVAPDTSEPSHAEDTYDNNSSTGIQDTESDEDAEFMRLMGNLTQD